jgi:hypothetical protein
MRIIAAIAALLFVVACAAQEQRGSGQLLVRTNSVEVGRRNTLNLLSGSNISMLATNEDGRVSVEISSTGGGGGGSDPTRLEKTNGVSWGTNEFHGTVYHKPTNAVQITKVVQQEFWMDNVNGVKVPYQIGYCVFPNGNGSVSNYVRFRGYNPNLDGNKPVVGQPSWYYVEELHYSPDAGDDFMENYWRDEFDNRQYMEVINKTSGQRASTSIMAPLTLKDSTSANELGSFVAFGSGASDGGKLNINGEVRVFGRSGGFGGVGGYYGENNAAIELRGVGSGGFYVNHDTANGSTNILIGQFGTANGFFVVQSETMFEDWIGFGDTAGKPPPIKIAPSGTNRLVFATGGRHGGITNDFVGSIFVQTATAGPTNTTSNTQLLSGVGHTNFNANFFNSVGRTIRVRLGGQYSTAATPGTYGFVIRIGGATVATNNLAVPASLSNQGWDMDATLTFRTVGASGTVMCDGWVNMNTNGNQAIRLPLKGATVDTTTTIDTTVAQNISVMAQTSVTTAPAQVRCSTGKIYLE